MTVLSPGRAILLGFVLVFVGFIIPLLNVLRVLEASLLLSFLSYGASVGGMLLGAIGAAQYVRKRRE
jgi:hypothetical protein